MAFVTIPRRGDIVCKEIATKAVKYIPLENYAAPSSAYEVIGVVAQVKNGKVLVVYKNNTAYPWVDRYYHKATGFVADGKAHTFTLSYRETSSASANTDVVITYKGATLGEVAASINAEMDKIAVLLSQEWECYAEDGAIVFHYKLTFYQQASYNTMKGGVNASAYLLPDVTAYANMRRKHGGVGGEGAVANLARAMAYFRADLSSTSYNPNATVTSVKRSYPVCLPAYLGTSQYQTDKCALLRQTYGEGEKGWEKFMRSCLAVHPCDWGNMGFNDGKGITKKIAEKTYTYKGVEKPLSRAFNYTYNIESQTIEKGEFWLPTPNEVAILLDGVKYNVVNNRDADKLNEGLNKIGGTAVSNGTSIWSCGRYSAGNAWHAYGSFGFFSNSSMTGSYGCVPVSLYSLKY